MEDQIIKIVKGKIATFEKYLDKGEEKWGKRSFTICSDKT